VTETEINSPKYHLLSADVRDTQGLQARLETHNIDTTKPTLILTECLLIYLKNEDSEGILKWASETFTNSLAILNYEMINPND